MEPPVNIKINNIETLEEKKDLEAKKVAILDSHSYTSFEQTFAKNSNENSAEEIIVKTNESMFNEEDKNKAAT